MSAFEYISLINEQETIIFSDLSANSIVQVGSSNQATSQVLTDGQFLIGKSGDLPTANQLAGTTNQVIVTNGAGSVTLSLPQSVSTGSSPIFDNLTLTGDLTLDDITIDHLTSNYINVVNVITGASARFSSLQSNNSNPTYLNSTTITGSSGFFTDLTATNSTHTNLSGTNGFFTNLSTDNLTLSSLSLDSLTSTDVKSNAISGTNIYFENIDGKTGVFNSISTSFLQADNVDSTNALFTTITGNKINNTSLVGNQATFITLTGSSISNTDLTSTNSLITNLTGTSISNTNLTSTNSLITTLTGTTINTSTLNFPATIGEKIVLYPTTSNYNIGIDSGRTYFNVNGPSDYFEFRHTNSGRFRIKHSGLEPATTNTMDLGTSSLFFKDNHLTNISSSNITGININSTLATLTNITGVLNLGSDNLILGSSSTKSTIVATAPSADRTITIADPGTNTNILLANTLSTTQNVNTRMDFTQGANTAFITINSGGLGQWIYANSTTGLRRCRLPETGYESFNDFIMAEGAQTLNNKTLTNSTISSSDFTTTNALITYLTGTTIKNTDLTSTNAVITNFTGTDAKFLGDVDIDIDLTMGGQFITNLDLDSSSTTSGCGIFAGGVGIGKKLYVGNEIHARTGVYFPNHLGSQTLLDYYEEYTFATNTVSNIYSTTQTCGGRVVRVGKSITIQFLNQVSATTNSAPGTSLDHNQTLPARFRPSANVVNPWILIVANSWEDGGIQITTAGAIQWLRKGVASWPASTTQTGIFAGAISYTILS